ncbi:MAG: phosphoribosylanthranilate isomerase [Gemmatimonadaceae bacterium]
MVEVKFCGLMREEDAEAAAHLGARYCGVVFAGGPRSLTPRDARRVLSAAGSEVAHVGVVARHSPEELRSLADEAGLDVIQLHADPDAHQVERARAATGRAIWAAVRVADRALPDRFDALCEVADAVVLDTFSPVALGGTGTPLNWEWLGAALSERGRGCGGGERAMIALAGGLRPENVAEAVRLLRPRIVDVSSGVEAAPGRKDHERMRAFIEAARAGTSS